MSATTLANPADCETHLLRFPFVKLSAAILRRQLITPDELGALAESSQPLNPLRGKTLSAANSSFSFALESLIKSPEVLRQWPEIQKSLRALQLESMKHQQVTAKTQREAGVLFAPRVVAQHGLHPNNSQVATLETRAGELLYAFPNSDRRLEVRKVGDNTWVKVLPTMRLRPLERSNYAQITLSEGEGGEVSVHLHSLFPGGHQLYRADTLLSRPPSEDQPPTVLITEHATTLISARVLPDGRHELLFNTSNLNQFRAICAGRECLFTPEAATDLGLYVLGDQIYSLQVNYLHNRFDRRHEVYRLLRLEGDQWATVEPAPASPKALHVKGQLFATQQGLVLMSIPGEHEVRIVFPLSPKRRDPIDLTLESGSPLYTTQFYETANGRILLATLSGQYNTVGEVRVYAPLESTTPLFRTEIPLSNIDAAFHFFEGGGLDQVFLSVQSGHMAQVFEPLAKSVVGQISLSSDFKSQTWVTHQGQTYVFVREGSKLTIHELFRGMKSSLEASEKSR